MSLPLAASCDLGQPVGRGVRHWVTKEGARPCHEQDEEGAREPVSRAPPAARPIGARSKETDQLVQASVAGVVVDVAAPPVAVIPVNDGKEK